MSSSLTQQTLIRTVVVIALGYLWYQRQSNTNQMTQESSETKVEFPSQNSYKYGDDIEKVLFESQQIANRVKELSERISEDYNGKQLVLVGLMRGAYHFLSDISRHLTIPHEIDIIGVTTYDGDHSTNKINLYHPLASNVKDKHILVIEDLVDTAFTLKWLLNDYFKNNITDHKSVKVACLLDKVEAKKVDGYEENVKPWCQYIGFQVENVFVVGYGMDYNQHYRSLPFIGVLKPEIYKSDWKDVLTKMHSINTKKEQ